MRSVVSSLFQLILGVPFKLAPDAINKSLRVSKVFLKESFKLRLRDWSDALMAMLVLGSSEANSATKKSDGKQSIIYPCGT